MATGQQELDTSEKIKSLTVAVNRLTCDNEDRQCELDVYRDNQEVITHEYTGDGCFIQENGSKTL